MKVPLVFGTRERVVRSGEKFRGECPKCGVTGRFHRAKKTFNVNVLVAVSIWDSEKDVVQCADCDAVFEPEDITPLPEEPKVSLAERLARAVQDGARAVGLDREKPSPAPEKRPLVDPEAPAEASPPAEKRRPPAPRPLSRDEEAEIDAELAAMKKRLGK
jgi:hypothetical protein